MNPQPIQEWKNDSSKVEYGAEARMGKSDNLSGGVNAEAI
jgi:hypothetical protein